MSKLENVGHGFVTVGLCLDIDLENIDLGLVLKVVVLSVLLSSLSKVSFSVLKLLVSGW